MGRAQWRVCDEDEERQGKGGGMHQGPRAEGGVGGAGDKGGSSI